MTPTDEPKPLRLGARVRYIGPSLFEGGKDWTGTVVRLSIPKPPKGQRAKPAEQRIMVDRGRTNKHTGKPKPTPVRPEHLRVI